MTQQKPSDICRRGLYKRISYWIQKNHWQSLDEDEKSWCLFALYFTGQWQQAEYYRKIWLFGDNSELLAHVFFARSIALVRLGELTGARREWVKVFREFQLRQGKHSSQRRSDESNRIASARGWYFQAQAFFSMQQSRWLAAERWASRAVLDSFESGNVLLRAIASDMQAHASVRLGRYSLALRLAQQAQACAKMLGNVGIENAIRVSVACWESERGHEPTGSLKTLRSLLKEKSFHDMHSQSVLMLEIARLLTLMGEFGQARQALARAERTLGSVGTQPILRMRVRLAQRKALLARFCGAPEQALLTLEPIFDEIPAFERELLLEVRGQMIAASFEAGHCPPAAWLREEREWTQVVRTDRALSAMRRREGRGLASIGASDDLLANIVERLISGTVSISLLQDVVMSGFVGLLHPRKTTSFADHVLFVVPGTNFVFLANSKRFRCLHGGVTQQMMLLLNCMAGKRVSKEELVRTVWQRRYFTERDDAGLYVLVQRLRVFLGDDKQLLVSHRGYYSLDAEVVPMNGFNVSEFTSDKMENRSFDSEKVSIAEISEKFHLRLWKLKEWIATRDIFSAEEWQHSANVSRASACRDLSIAEEKGWVTKIGRGRAVVYRVVRM